MNTTTRPRAAAFGLPLPAAVSSGVQSSSITLEGTVLQKEVVSKVVRLPNDELGVLQISKPATAVDVYVDLRNVPASALAFMIVRVYAINGNTRILVARGRTNNATLAAGLAAGRQWEKAKLVASARCAAESFEVTIQTDSMPGAPVVFLPTSPVEFPISAIGYQATGTHPLAPPLRLHQTANFGQFNFNVDCEILSVEGLNGDPAGTAARFIQLWDTTIAGGGAAGAAAVLLAELLVPPQSSFSWDFENHPLYFAQGFCFAASTTRGAFVSAVMPGSFSYEVR